MKTGYAIGVAIVGFFLLICIDKTNRSERKIVRNVRHIFDFAFLAVAANIVITLSGNERVSLAAYGVFFSAMDWVLLEILFFVLDFAKIEGSGRRFVKPVVWRLLLGADTLSLLLNFFFGHAFRCEAVSMADGELYFHPVYHAAYYVHLALSYFLILLIFVTLLYKTLHTAKVYRMKYVFVLSILAFIVVVDAVFKLTASAVNVSVICYALAAFIIYYFAAVYAPRELIRQTLSMVIEGLEDAVFIFDEDGNCIHVNHRAGEVMRQEGLTLRGVEESFAGWCAENDCHVRRSAEYTVTRQYGERTVYYRSFFSSLQDDGQRYLGGFFTVQDRTEEIKKLEKERYAANHDELTGLYNRQCFYRKAAERLQADPTGQYLILCSDVRNFKIINDVFGEEKGDKLLVRIGRALRMCTGSDEIYARLESDRFALLMRKEDYREAVFATEAVKLLRIEGNDNYAIQLCLGVYEVTDREVPIPVMCDRALMAAATLKENYGKQVAYYDETLRGNILREQELTGELEEAIEAGQFCMFLQPQMNGKGEALGAEALVRWKHPKKGMISPGEFIPVFERNGMITKLDYYMWECACRQLKKWKEQGREDLYISVNISPKDFYFMDVYQAFSELVEKYGVSAKNLKLEITETAVMSELEKQQNLIAQLRGKGFAVEMDDFGSGYSSLNMLKDIQVDTLKIDMAFLGKTDNEERAFKILKMIVELSKQLEIPVITEGVETAEQVDFLRDIGCDMFQGYYFAKPMQVSDFEKKYMEA